MKKTTYIDVPFFCGSCGKHLHFMHRTYGAWYVHADNHKFHCGKREWFGFRSNTLTQPLGSESLDKELKARILDRRS